MKNHWQTQRIKKPNRPTSSTRTKITCKKQKQINEQKRLKNKGMRQKKQAKMENYKDSKQTYNEILQIYKR